MILGLNLTVIDDDIVDVWGSLYVKTPEALKRLLGELRDLNYDVQDNRKSQYERDRTDPAVMEKNGWCLWFASLPRLEVGVCKTCKQHISTLGIWAHGHKCEKCGSVTYLDMVDGSRICFVFNNDDRQLLPKKLSMKVKSLDVKRGLLFLYPDSFDDDRFSMTGETAQEYLNENWKLWKWEKLGNKRFIAVKYLPSWMRMKNKSFQSAIEPYDVFGHVRNAKVVKIWEGKQYSDFERIPIPETICIYEAWHWMPLQKSPKLHEKLISAVGMVSRQDYYYTNGRTEFYPKHGEAMLKFVKHFTALDAADFEKAWARFRKSGPGMIQDLGYYCSGNELPEIDNQPNFAHSLILFAKMMANEQPTKAEMEQGMRGLNDFPI